MDIKQLTLVIGAVLGAISVALGAFGAHALRDVLTQNNRLETFQTATQYLQIHALALVAVGILLRQTAGDVGLLQSASVAFVVGCVAFSGSLYVLAIGNVRVMGAIAPIGGVAFIIGWVLVAWWALQS